MHALVPACVAAAAGLGLGQPDAVQAPSRPLPNIRIEDIDRTFHLTGKVGLPLGEIFTVQGILESGDQKGWSIGHTLRISRLNGVATQRLIRLPLDSAFGTFDGSDRLPTLELGMSYEFRGYESGGFVGHPCGVHEELGFAIQTSDHHFQSVLLALKGRRIQESSTHPRDFIDRPALIAGIAKNIEGRAAIVASDWQLVIEGATEWPASDLGRDVEAWATLRSTDTRDRYLAEAAKVRLTRLDDQVGRRVQLRARAWSLNGEWWLEYRGTPVFVEGMSETLATSDRHGAPVMVRGWLEKRPIPKDSLEHVWRDAERTAAYTITDAQVEPLAELLSPEEPIRRDE